MPKIIRLTESDLTLIIKRVISENKKNITESRNRRGLINEAPNGFGCLNANNYNRQISTGASRIFSKNLKLDGNMVQTNMSFGPNGAWNLTNPNRQPIQGVWYCTAKGFAIKTTTPSMYFNAMNQGYSPDNLGGNSYYNFDSSRASNDPFDSGGWYDNGHQGPTPEKVAPKPVAKKPATQQTPQTKQPTTQQPVTKSKYVKPQGLENIKSFQDWLDQNYSDEKLGQGRGWAAGLPGGKLNRGRGYGVYGPRTNKAWEIYGDVYGQNKQLQLAPQAQQSMENQNQLLWGNQTLTPQPQIVRPQ